MNNSPYKNKDISEWMSITEKLINKFPIKLNDIKNLVEKSFADYLSITISEAKLQVGRDIFFPAQATGVIIQKLIARKLEIFQSSKWREGDKKKDKDIVNIQDNSFSFEIKTSSSKTGIYGNRSMGHVSENSIKKRSGYYLIINYKLPKEEDREFLIYNLRFGWIDDEDWIGQKSPTGQQSTISKSCRSLKLISIY